jgi:hypothetical protein
MIGSLGCPYRCSFCIDSGVDYQPLAPDALREDLVFLRDQLPKAIVGWHDPNFGVRFDEYFSVIEDSVRPGELRFVAESSLSLLKEDRLALLKRYGFRGLTIGIESWFDFNAKANQSQRRGAEKMRSLAEHVELVTRYIPYVQTNFVWGLDQDQGDLPFQLTKDFIDRVPAAFPSHSLHTAYGNSAPAGRQLAAEGRVLDVPFRFQDTSSIHNVRLANYAASDFYARMEDLVRHSYSARATWRRVMLSHHPISDAARWMNLIRSTSQSFRIQHFRHLRERFAVDREFMAFESEPGSPAPELFRRSVVPELGVFAAHLPRDIVDYLAGSGRVESPLLAPQH